MANDKAEPPVEPGVDGLILCGGRGERMGGIDKGLMTFGREPAVAVVAELLHPVCHRIYISANRNLATYKRLNLGPVIEDLRPGFPGPLGGLEAVSGHVQRELLLVLPCDMPGLPESVPHRLLAALAHDEAMDLAYACANGDNHYLVAAVRSRSLKAIGPVLDRGDRAVRDWFRELATTAVEFSGTDAAAFRNRNDADAWAR